MQMNSFFFPGALRIFYLQIFGEINNIQDLNMK